MQAYPTAIFRSNDPRYCRARRPLKRVTIPLDMTASNGSQRTRAAQTMAERSLRALLALAGTVAACSQAAQPSNGPVTSAAAGSGQGSDGGLLGSPPTPRDKNPGAAGSSASGAAGASDADSGAAGSGSSVSTPAPAQISIGADKTSVTGGSSINVSGLLTQVVGSTPLRAKTVGLQLLRNGTWTASGSADTDTSGRYSIGAQLTDTGSVSLRSIFAGDSQYAAATSDTLSISVTAAGCSYPVGPYGTSEGKVVDSAWVLDLFAPGATSIAQIAIKDFFDCDGSKHINSLLIVSGDAWCSDCQNEASQFPDEMSNGWRAAGVVVIDLIVQDANHDAATQQTAALWRSTFGLDIPGVYVGYDPAYHMESPASGSVPYKTLVNPRDMTIVSTYTATDDGPALQLAHQNGG
jgi:hypothetical protein